MTNSTSDKFYDFINMYNAIVKHCATKKRHYNISLFHIDDTLYFKVIDRETLSLIHNDSIECNLEESKLLYNMITSEFILNHQLKYAAYIPMSNDDIISFLKLSKNKPNLTTNQQDYFNNQQLMQIHTLENSIFTLNIYQYNGIDEQTELLHQMAIDKINKINTKKLELRKK